MSTIDEKYLGDRIKALEENIGAVSRTLQLEHNSDPNGERSVFLLLYHQVLVVMQQYQQAIIL